MGIFDLFKEKGNRDEKTERQQETEERPEFEFEKNYDYSVEVPEIDEDTGQETGRNIILQGTISITADLIWNEDDESYNADYSWNDLSGNFDDKYGDLPSTLDNEFYEDAKNYLLSQGVSLHDIMW